MKCSMGIGMLLWLLVLPVAAQAYPLGDLNCDGVLDLRDINPFTLALSNPAGYALAFPDCDLMLADCNDDGAVDFGDINVFVQLLSGGPGEIFAVELAGHALAGYPHFEYVRAINEQESVEVAIDPTRYPSVVGETADLYIVAAKTSGGWAVDPALIDVRDDGPQTVILGGTTIQENTFLAAAPNELDGFAGIGLGVGYDVVLDLNQNAQLDGGDYIDGLSNEAGFYAVQDTASPGPLAVTEVIYSGGTWLGQDLYYPTDIDELGLLPLVVVSHGNGHDYTWYDHIGYHLASYGYIVMSHQNNTGPGVESASTTTLTNTDYIIGNQGSIQGGVLEGHLDSSRITWIGHSRGGEGVVRAYTRVRTGAYNPTHFVTDDVRLVTSMAPVTHISPAAASTPFDVAYHMFIAGADSDVTGSADPSNSKPLAFYERAYGHKQLVYIHGCGHAWLHAGPPDPSWASGPGLIGQAAAHTIVRGYILPLVKLYIDNNLVARDYFARRNDHFRPAGIPGDVVLSNYHRQAEEAVNFVVDDYETNPSTSLSSSGGSVTFDVANLNEVLMQDIDGSFAWTGSQPSNGMTMYRYSDDNPHCVVFDWPNGSSLYYQLAVVPEERNFTDDTYLQFRACQGTRHPYTDSLDGPLSFTVTLEDGAGTSSSLDFGHMGHITRTYERDGGWANEFNVVRVRLTDFLTNGSGLDLSDVAAIRFQFGAAFGSSRGRIGLDDVDIIADLPPYFVPLTIQLAAAPPEFLPPDVPTVLDVEILEGNDTLVEGSALLHYRYDGGAWLSTPMAQVAGSVFAAELPAPACGDLPEYYLSAEGAVTGVVYAPAGGASNPFVSYVGTFNSLLDDDFETDMGWTVESDPSLTGGEWERGVPIDDGVNGDPTEDYDGSGQCYLTQNMLGNSDVDWGPTWLISPPFDMADLSDPVMRFAWWWANDDQDGDPMHVEVGTYDAVGEVWEWTLVDTIANQPPEWFEAVYAIADYIVLTDQVRIRISVQDQPNNSIDEGAIDAFEVFDVTCP